MIFTMHSPEEIREYISSNYKDQFKDSFPQLIQTTIGSPIRIFDQDRKQKYWLIPLLIKSKVRGSAIFEIQGKLVTHGVLNPNVQNAEKLIDKDYFEKVPDKLFTEVIDFYKGFKVVSLFFSYDQTPQKWGWLLILKNNSSPDLKHVYINPNGWYEKNIQRGFEG